MSRMMPFIRTLWSEGRVTREQLDTFVSRGFITPEERATLIGDVA